MSSNSVVQPATTLDLSKWRKVPDALIWVGGLLAFIGAVVDVKQFGYSWLLAFMFFLSLCLGALFLVLLHHLFDAMWMVPIRRFLEHQACLLPVMFFLFLPIALLAGKIYPWMDPAHADHALHAKSAYLNPTFWYLRVAILFGVWTWLTTSLRKWSLRQDVTGSAECTFRMRKLAAGGIFIFALTLTTAAIDWMKSIEHQFYSTMYGVYYFAGSVWTTLATVYLVMAVLQRAGPLKDVVRPQQFHDTAKVLFAFTVFYAYIHFSQYFLIWNAAMPEETFWYIKRETGSWWDIGLVIVFGHFVLPFLGLLRIDAKFNLTLMIPLCLWCWLMHFCDMSFNIMPALHPNGFHLDWTNLACLAFFAGVLSKVFIKSFNAHPPYPQRDPRIAETMGVYVPPASAGQAGDPAAAK